MNQRIYKYTLNLTDLQEVTMPAGAEILSAANQNGSLCLWALVDTDKESRRRFIEIIGTGNPIEKNDNIIRRFIGTAVMNPFVWHVFERNMT